MHKVQDEIEAPDLRGSGLDLNIDQPISFLELDPDKIYVMVLSSDVDKDAVFSIVSELSPRFKSGKGELLVITRGKMSVTNYDIRDLEVIRSKIERMIQVLKEKNNDKLNRYDHLLHE